jgi:hypothetical protein
MKIEVSEHIFEKAQISDFIKIRPVAAELFHADGRTETDVTKLIVTFRNYANTPKMAINCATYLNENSQNFCPRTDRLHYPVRNRMMFSKKYTNEYR